MNDAQLDARLSALLRDDSPAGSSDDFAERVIALVAHDLSRRQWRRRTAVRIASETLALLAVLSVFAMLSRMAPDNVGSGDILSLASPAMLGLVVLVMWGLTALSPARN